MFRKTTLLIALLATCLLITVAVWLRTQFRSDVLQKSNEGMTTFVFFTNPGKLRIVLGEIRSDAVPDDGWEYSSFFAGSDGTSGFLLIFTKTQGGFLSEDTVTIGIPIWSLAVLQVVSLVFLFRARRRALNVARGYSVMLRESPAQSAPEN